MKPRINVLIPCENEAAFLFECLNSLAAQTMPDFEALVIDDCSSENVAQVVASHGDPRFKCLRHERRRGLAACRHTGFRAGDAPFILCMDPGDHLDPNFLEATAAVLQNDDGIDCVFTDSQMVGLSQARWRGAVRTAEDLAVSPWIPGVGALTRRSVWERTGGYDESTGLPIEHADWDFWIAAMTGGLLAHHLPAPLYVRRARLPTPCSLRSEWKAREVILKRNPAFFSMGKRRQRFRSEGLLMSARAWKLAHEYRTALRLALESLAEQPGLLLPLTRGVIRKAGARALRPLRRAGARIKNLARRTAPFATESRVERSRDWDSSALAIHERYGHLSHDYAVLEEIIIQTNARSVLEIGCGSGRLFPVYLKSDLRPIWGQDVSSQALAICRQRFHRQQQIQYLPGEILAIPADLWVDLIVSTRVLQHILDDSMLRQVLSHLAPMSGAFFVNETGSNEPGSTAHGGLKGRNYASYFEQLGFRLAREGSVEAEGNARQYWKLFARVQS